MLAEVQHTDGTGAIGWGSRQRALLAFLLSAHKKSLAANHFSCHFVLSASLWLTRLTFFPSLGPLVLSILLSPIFELLSQALSGN